MQYRFIAFRRALCYNLFALKRPFTAVLRIYHNVNRRHFMARNQFPNFAGGNMQQLMRQAQKMQEQLEKAQEDLDTREYEAQAGGGMVTCRVNGKREILSLSIKPEAVDPDDVEMLEDMVMAAVNEALRAGEQAREETLGKMAPGGMGNLL